MQNEYDTRPKFGYTQRNEIAQGMVKNRVNIQILIFLLLCVMTLKTPQSEYSNNMLRIFSVFKIKCMTKSSQLYIYMYIKSLLFLVA